MIQPLTAHWETKQLDVLQGNRPISRMWLTYDGQVIWESHWVLDVKLKTSLTHLMDQLTKAIECFHGHVSWSIT